MPLLTLVGVRGYGLFAARGGGVAGYVGGGYNGSNGITTIDKFTFPSDVRSTLATGMSTVRMGNAAFSDPGTAGYFSGGDPQSNNPHTSTDRFAFPSDVRSAVTAQLAQRRYNTAGMSNFGVAGYVGGGFTGSSTVDSIEKFAFPSESRTNVSAGLPSSRSELAAAANNAVAGYFVGGELAGTYPSTHRKLAFPTDTASNITVDRAYRLAGMANSGVAAYFCGGFTNTGASLSQLHRVDFATDTTSVPGAAFSVGTRAYVGAMSNNGVAGYFAGGSGSSGMSSVDRFAFPAETQSVVPGGLSTSMESISGMANSGAA